MTLLASLTSPYARKLRVLALELGLEMDVVETVPMDDGDALLAANPLGKVPVLIDAAGIAIVDSPVIAGYLLSLVPENRLLAASGPTHWRGRTTEAIADGILDAAIILRFNAAQGVTSGVWVERQFRAIDRALAALAARIEGDQGFGDLCTVIACEYLDLRWPGIDWRHDQPALAALAAQLAERPALRATRPPV